MPKFTFVKIYFKMFNLTSLRVGRVLRFHKLTLLDFKFSAQRHEALKRSLRPVNEASSEATVQRSVPSHLLAPTRPAPTRRLIAVYGGVDTRAAPSGEVYSCR